MERGPQQNQYVSDQIVVTEEQKFSEPVQIQEIMEESDENESLIRRGEETTNQNRFETEQEEILNSRILNSQESENENITHNPAYESNKALIPRNHKSKKIRKRPSSSGQASNAQSDPSQ